MFLTNFLYCMNTYCFSIIPLSMEGGYIKRLFSVKTEVKGHSFLRV